MMYKNKKIIIIIVSSLVFKLFLWFIPFFNVYTEIACVGEYVRAQSVVYIPESTPIKFYYDPVGVFFGNDLFEYWRIKPDKKEKEILLKEVNNPQWSKIEGYGAYSNIFSRLLYSYDGLLSEWAKTSPLEDNSSYICLFDCNQNIVISDEEAYLCPDLMVFIYDTDDNLYYCIYQTV